MTSPAADPPVSQETATAVSVTAVTAVEAGCETCHSGLVVWWSDLALGAALT